MTWYRSRGNKFEAVEIKRDTPSQVVLPSGKRAAKISEWTCYFPTWEAAKQHRVSEAQSRVNACNIRLDTAQRDLSVAKALKPPR